MSRGRTLAKYSAITAAVAAIVALLWFLTHSEKSPVAFLFALQHVINEEKRFLLYQVDHPLLAQTLRDFAEQQHWAESAFNKDDPRVPAALRVLKPSAIFVHPDFIALDFGGSFLAMDIRAFKPGLEGSGTKKLGDGLWFYSEDGSTPHE
jgi:hypothetical protein